MTNEANLAGKQPSTNPKIVIALLLVCAVMAIILITCRAREKSKLALEERVVPSASGADLFYYAAADNIVAAGPEVYPFYKFNGDSQKQEELVFTETTRFNSIEKLPTANEILLVFTHVIRRVNILSGEQADIVSLPDDTDIVSAKLSHDGSRLAISAIGGEEAADSRGEIFVYDLKTMESIQIFEKHPLKDFSTLTVLGWNKGDSRVIAQEAGGDAGYVWGDVFTVDIATPNNITLIPIEEDIFPDFFRGNLSPDGEHWLYSHCANPGEIVESLSSVNVSCPDGMELIVYSINKNRHQPIYRNASHDDNESGNILRVIFSFMWLDENNVVFTNPDGIYRLNLADLIPSKLHEFNWTTPLEIADDPSILVYADESRVAFQRDGVYGGMFIWNADSGKVLEIGQQISSNFIIPASPIEQFFSWGE